MPRSITCKATRRGSSSRSIRFHSKKVAGRKHLQSAVSEATRRAEHRSGWLRKESAKCEPGQQKGPSLKRLIAEARAHAPGAFDPRMIRLDRFQISRHLGDGHGLCTVAACGDHDAENIFVNQFDTFGGEPRRQ